MAEKEGSAGLGVEGMGSNLMQINYPKIKEYLASHHPPTGN